MPPEPITELPTTATRSAPTDSPAWSAMAGVTGREEREVELGAGKWTEPARSLDEVRKQLPDSPVRELSLQTSGSSRTRYVGVALLFGAIVVGGLWLLRPPGTPDAPGVPLGAGGPRATEAAPGGPTVTVSTEPAGARLTLDGKRLGRAPVAVAVPTDDAHHELCAEFGKKRSCRSLTGTALSLQDPYIFHLGDGATEGR